MKEALILINLIKGSWSTAGLTPKKLYFKHKRSSAAGISQQLLSSFISLIRHPRSSTATVTAHLNGRGSADIFHLEREKKKHAKSRNVLDQRAQLQREQGFLALHFFFVAFCPLNVLDILRRRSKAQERDVACMWVSRYNVGWSKASQREYAV